MLRFEATRILLKHPYQRRKENPELVYQASNLTLQEYLRTTLPLPSARETFGHDEYNQQYFEFYYYKLIEQQDQETMGAGGGASDSSDESGDNNMSASGMQGGGSSDENQKESEQEQDTQNNGAGGVGEDHDQSDSDSDSDGDGEHDGSESEQSDQPESNQGSGKRKQPPEQEVPQESGPTAQPPASQSPSSQSPLEQYSDPQTSGRENTQDWDGDDLWSDRINDQIRTASENNTWGSVSGSLRERVLASLKPKLDYRSVLRQFRTTILSSSRSLTRMKPSRRYGFLYMGSRRDFTTKLLFAVDVSGSISSQDLARGFSVINRFFKYGIQSIDVIQFDTEIKGKSMTLKKARQNMTVLGRGGTDFQDVVNYINEHPDYDGLIIFTDGFAPVPDKPKNKKTRILWLFNQESNYNSIYPGLKHLGPGAFLKED